MPAREEVDVVIAGGASHVVSLAGACTELTTRVDIVRIGGASAGAIRAAGEAFAIDVGTMKSLMHQVLVADYLKDMSWMPMTRFGIYKGDNLHKALKSVFGDKKMGESLIPLRITVCDLWTRQPLMIDSENPKHMNLKVIDVLRCSAAIPVFFKAWKLPELFGNRLFVDGGTAANFSLGMFDDSERRTVGLRLQPASPDDVKPVRDLPSFAEAIGSLVLWASDNAYISKKRYADVITVPQIGSGLDFNLDKKMIDDRWNAGVLAVKNFQFTPRSQTTAPIV